ncbi:MAG TPA: hypothetical protein VK943_03790 [Arenibaculum sp.]|nr:hypothetical protein [Arenibaculum sp.]
MSFATAGLPDELIDTTAYPLDDPAAPAGRALVAACREQLAETGCVVLKAFIRADALPVLTAESRRLGPTAHFNSTRTNPYNGSGDASLPADHPRNVFQRRDNGFVAGDQIGPETAVRRLYEDPRLKALVAACVGAGEIHEYADPLAGLVINVLRPGCQHPWHYDTNEFIVSVMTQEPEDGGLFEYCPGIRSPEGENFDAVGRVLAGDRGPVRSLKLEPGDLQIFFGRYSLHRVAPVAGCRERHTLILGYAKEPGVIGRPERTRNIFGRCTQAHIDAEASRRRADTLED